VSRSTDRITREYPVDPEEKGDASMAMIAVTGASGQLGSEIVKATIEVAGKDRVIGLARTPSKAKSLEIEVRPGDYDSPRDLQASLQGIDSLLLLSGMDAPEKRIQQHRNVIKAAQQAGVGKIVYTSVQGAEERTAFSPIVQSNRQTEEDIRHSGLQWVIGRNGIYIEPDVEYIETYQQRGEIANCAADGATRLVLNWRMRTPEC
jgi:NAD(P)H dehydrogenase (quinone)